MTEAERDNATGPWRGPRAGRPGQDPGGPPAAGTAWVTRSDTDRRVVTAAILAVPLSSLLGLLSPMVEFGGGLFINVWTANLWGSLLFTAGTAATFVACVRFVSWALNHAPMDQRSLFLTAAFPGVFALTWFVYALSWSFTGSSFVDTAQTFLNPMPHWEANFNIVLMWGWPGIFGCGVLMPIAAIQLARSVGRPGGRRR